MPRSKNIANESCKTKQAREKLRRRLEKIDNQITPDALKTKKIEIDRWISRYVKSRKILKDKNISLFDENQNSAKLSNYVSTISQKLKNDIQLFHGEVNWKSLGRRVEMLVQDVDSLNEAD